MMIFYEGVVW